MILGTALIVLVWVLFVPTLSLHLAWAIVLTVLGAFIILFGLLFGVYFFNIDMKALSLVQKLLLKMHDKKAKEKKRKI